MRLMNVPMSTAPKVLSNDGSFGSSSRGLAGAPVGDERRDSDMVFLPSS